MDNMAKDDLGLEFSFKGIPVQMDACGRRQRVDRGRLQIAFVRWSTGESEGSCIGR